MAVPVESQHRVKAAVDVSSGRLAGGTLLCVRGEGYFLVATGEVVEEGADVTGIWVLRGHVLERGRAVLFEVVSRIRTLLADVTADEEVRDRYRSFRTDALG